MLIEQTIYAFSNLFSSNNLFKKLGLALGLGLVLNVAYAQQADCVVNPTLDTENAWNTLKADSDFGGATFVACESGYIIAINLKVHEESTEQPNATLYLEEGMGNAMVTNGKVEYLQNVSLLGEGATTKIVLATPFKVEKNKKYTWYVRKDLEAGVLIQSATIEPNNVYADGKTWYNNQEYDTMDTVFSIEIQAGE